jgi:type IV pilus assembly protein PilM
MVGSQKSASRPHLACEITVSRVIGARSSNNGAALEVFTSRHLTPGTVVPALSGGNIHDAAAVRTAISGALAAVGGKTRDVIAILPDAAVRVLLLEFDDLPSKAKESEAVIRFRLKKSLPFDVDRCALSCDVRRANGTIQVVAAVSPREVVDEYEAAFRDAGYSPGVVLPSSLAALGLLEGERPTLMLKVDPANITVAATVSQELRLMRTLDNPHGENVAAAELAEAVLPSIVFFEDTFGSRIERIFVAGVASLDEAGPMLHQQTGAQVEELAPSISSGANLGGDQFKPSMMAGVAGALLG